MKKNLLNRLFTSIILLSILLTCIIQNKLLWLLLVIVCLIICYLEFANILKSFIKKYIIYYLSLLTTLIFIISLFIICSLIYDYSIVFLIFVISVTIFSDVGGYVAGKLIGGKRLTKISPNKTISGSVGSFIFSLIPCPLIQIILNKFSFFEENFDNIFTILIFSLFLSLICQFGDLFISYFKRKAKVKDTGKILPGHGGLLDRVDGLIFVLPAGYISNIFLNII